MDILFAQIAPEYTPKFSLKRVVKRLKSLRRVVKTLSLPRRVTSEGTLITQVTSEGPPKFTKEGQ